MLEESNFPFISLLAKRKRKKEKRRRFFMDKEVSMDKMVVRIEILWEKESGERECRYLSGKKAQQEVAVLSEAQMYPSISDMLQNWEKVYSSPNSTKAHL